MSLNLSRRTKLSAGGAPGAAYAAAVLADAPDAYYKMNDASGNPVDSSGNNRHIASISGGSLTYGQTGPWVGAPSVFMPSACYMRTPDSVALGDRYFSLEFWAKKSTSGNGLNPRLLSAVGGSSHHWCIENGEDSQGPGMYTREGGPNDPSPMSTTEFRHYVITYDFDFVRVYRNGVQVDSDIRGVTTPLSFWQIGSNGDNFQGWFSHVAFYPTVLPAARVAAHYAARG